MSGRKVQFLVAGVQKGGTTALFDYLVEHPQLSLPAEKEVHFFDDEVGVDWAAPDYAAYHARFAADDGRLRGEATPIYIYWPDSLARIAAYNPAMRIILLFRDPSERAWSHWRMEFARGAETQPFSWCIRDGRARVAANVSPPGVHREFSYVERGFYGAQLQRLYRLFPRAQVLTLQAEDLKHRPEVALAQVTRFLGVAPFAGPITPRRVHVGRPTAADHPTPDDAALLAGLYREDQALFQALMTEG